MSYGQQLDIPLSNGKFFNISKHIPGRVMTDDFVFFNNYSRVIDPSKYGVYMSSNDMAGTSYTRFLGFLGERVEVPHVHLDAYAKIYVQPLSKNPKLPFYVARLNRGSTYSIPNMTSPGVHQMHMHGVHTGGFAF